MSFPNIVQYLVFLLVIALLVKPLSSYLARVFKSGKTLLNPALRPIERVIYKLGGVDAAEEMSWKQYALSFSGSRWPEP